MSGQASGKRKSAGRNLLLKAKAISEAEAHYIIDHATATTSEWAVLQHNDQWFDVRSLTEKELMNFINELDRGWNEELVAGILHPH